MSKFEFWVSAAMIVWAIGIVLLFLWGPWMMIHPRRKEGESNE